MSKYIDAEHLRKEVKILEKASHKFALGCADRETRKFHEGKDYAYQHVGVIIDSLQQEQSEFSSNLVDIDAVREDFMTEVYRVLDADSTNDRANAIIYAFDSLPTVCQEQPEVDLEKEVRTYCCSSFRFNYDELNDSFYSNAFEFDDVVELARHFYELGQQEMRHRITNPEYNAKVVEQLKSEYPIIKE